ncbi:MAG: AAA family ATPase [Chlorobi bacterium]|nr:AAA family ATPase [Chlorobiota bacterium]
MLQEHLIDALSRNLTYKPTAGQLRLFGELAGFIRDPGKPEVLLIKGYSGTGKTSAMKSLTDVLDHLNIHALLMAPTGRAAKVLASYTGREAFTIHKKIYRQKSAKDGFGRFVLNFNAAFQTIFIVDEASMIPDHSSDPSVFGSGKLLDDLFSFVFSGKQCKLILIGDAAQLPPVGLEISPALDKSYLEKYGYPVTGVFLDEVVRQEEGSGILSNATYIRKKISSRNFSLPLFDLNACTDVVRINGREMIELLEDYYRDDSNDEAVIIVRSNRMANRYNHGIRQQILYREEELAVGDRIMVVKNNYYWMPEGEDFLANGDIFEIVEVGGYEERYGYRFADITINVPGKSPYQMDVYVMLDTLNIDAPALSAKQNKELFYAILEDFPEKKKTRKMYNEVRGNLYFNALQIKFAYAVTCHKAQGGQWSTVFLDQGYIPQENLNVEYLRWLYTALTRATEKVYLVNFHDMFFRS